jgi:hypothetical protein
MLRGALLLISGPSHSWTVMPSSITQLVVGIAVAFGVAVVSVGPIGSAGAQSPIEIIAQEALTNRFETPLSETDFRLSDRQQLRIHFLDGRDRLR